MIPHIIHNPDHWRRFDVLAKELETQGITEYKLCPAFMEDIAFHGINKAFKNVIQMAKDEGLESVVIFEDDIKFTAPGAYDHWIKNTPEDYDIWFGGIFLGEIAEDKTTLKSFTAMHCIRVHSRFYDTFLSADPLMHIDVALQGLGVFKVIYPFIAAQHNGMSYNARHECNFDPLLERWEWFK